jgi:Protein of unknown function (DUF1761)
VEVSVNYAAVLLAAISSMLVGGIWYAKPVFGTEWMKLAKVDEKKAQKDAGKAMGGMFVLALVMAYILSHMIYFASLHFSDRSFFSIGLTTALFAWVGFVLPTVASSSLFEQRRKKLTAINLGNWLVTLVVMGAIIGKMGL